MATSDLYGDLKVIAAMWGDAISNAKSPSDAADYAARYLLMLDCMNRTMADVEKLARGVLAERAGAHPEGKVMA